MAAIRAGTRGTERDRLSHFYKHAPTAWALRNCTVEFYNHQNIGSWTSLVRRLLDPCVQSRDR